MGSAQEVSGVRGGGSWRQLDSRAWLATGRMDRSAAKCSQHCPERDHCSPMAEEGRSGCSQGHPALTQAPLPSQLPRLCVCPSSPQECPFLSSNSFDIS